MEDQPNTRPGTPDYSKWHKQLLALQDTLKQLTGDGADRRDDGEDKPREDGDAQIARRDERGVMQAQAEAMEKIAGTLADILRAMEAARQQPVIPRGVDPRQWAGTLSDPDAIDEMLHDLPDELRGRAARPWRDALRRRMAELERAQKAKDAPRADEPNDPPFEFIPPEAHIPQDVLDREEEVRRVAAMQRERPRVRRDEPADDDAKFAWRQVPAPTLESLLPNAGRVAGDVTDVRPTDWQSPVPNAGRVAGDAIDAWTPPAPREDDGRLPEWISESVNRVDPMKDAGRAHAEYFDALRLHLETTTRLLHGATRDIRGDYVRLEQIDRYFSYDRGEP